MKNQLGYFRRNFMAKTHSISSITTAPMVTPELVTTTVAHTITLHPLKRKKYKLSGYISTKDVYIREVIYSNPATIVVWSDGTKTISKCTENDNYNEEFGLTLCILKKVLGATAVKNILVDWVPEQTFFTAQKITIADLLRKYK